MRPCMSTREGFGSENLELCEKSARNIVEDDSLDTSVSEERRQEARAFLAKLDAKQEK